MFLLKKIIAPLLFPMSLCLGLLLSGLVLLWFTQKQKLGKILVTAGAALLLLMSYWAVPEALLRPLEYRHAALLDLDEHVDVKWVVVLGGGHTSDPRLPANSQLGEASLARVIEGIRIHQLLPDSKLLLSGGGAFDSVPNAVVMGDVARMLGVDESDVVLEAESRDTKDEARLIREIIGEERIVLVTSASHMPRSMALFRKMGMQPIAAPTDYEVKEHQGAVRPSLFFPGADDMEKAERAVHEYLGLVWAWMRGQV